MRPETLALRAVNQYRTRDVIPYLGLRYYFVNLCARRDRWAEDVATHIVRTRIEPSYFKSEHFKELHKNGSAVHREIFLPGPNEAFAEAALIAECSKHTAFLSLSCVFSYRLAVGDDTRGIYVPYFEGFRDRHIAITKACERHLDAVVLYTDIKKFYPSITAGIARVGWNAACEKADLAPQWRELGLKLLSDHADIASMHVSGSGLLTGPMFSHLIANLILRTIDDQMVENFSDRYFRYVDDVVLVGTKKDVAEGRAVLAALLGEIGLHLHTSDQGKDFEVDAKEWLEGTGDFNNQDGQHWARFVGNLKQFLGTKPVDDDSLAAEFVKAGFRIPIPQYKLATNEAPWRLRILARLRKYKWLSRKFRMTSAAQIIHTAQILREHYAQCLRDQLEFGSSINGYKRKRAIPKIRFFAGRLLYLGTLEMLFEFSSSLDNYDELHMLAEVMRSVATRDITRLLPLGSNAAQSAAQILSLSRDSVSCHIENWTPVCLQGLAILRMNGVQVNGPSDDNLNQFADWSTDSQKLMGPEIDPSIRELACLHGVAEIGRHSEILNTVFDWDETLAFDVINQFAESDY
jgi:hypothetical protein